MVCEGDGLLLGLPCYRFPSLSPSPSGRSEKAVSKFCNQKSSKVHLLLWAIVEICRNKVKKNEKPSGLSVISLHRSRLALAGSAPLATLAVPVPKFCWGTPSAPWRLRSVPRSPRWYFLGKIDALGVLQDFELFVLFICMCSMPKNICFLDW